MAANAKQEARTKTIDNDEMHKGVGQWLVVACVVVLRLCSGTIWR